MPRGVVRTGVSVCVNARAVCPPSPLFPSVVPRDNVTITFKESRATNKRSSSTNASSSLKRAIRSNYPPSEKPSRSHERARANKLARIGVINVSPRSPANASPACWRSDDFPRQIIPFAFSSIRMTRTRETASLFIESTREKLDSVYQPTSHPTNQPPRIPVRSFSHLRGHFISRLDDRSLVRSRRFGPSPLVSSCPTVTRQLCEGTRRRFGDG